jgi:hypothetical protein
MLDIQIASAAAAAPTTIAPPPAVKAAYAIPANAIARTKKRAPSARRWLGACTGATLLAQRLVALPLVLAVALPGLILRVEPAALGGAPVLPDSRLVTALALRLELSAFGRLVVLGLILFAHERAVPGGERHNPAAE